MSTFGCSYNWPSKIWLGGTCFLLWLMILLGGATRLTHSGLSIVEWQPLKGIIPPLTINEWQQIFQLYQQFPEYHSLNPRPQLGDFKFIFWMEYTHRLLGRLIGVFFLLPLVVFWRSLSSSFKKRGCIILILGFLQGAVGWYMVKSGLVKDPVVSPYRLTLHLGLAFALYGMVLWMVFDAFLPKTTPLKKHWPHEIVFGLQILTMLYGGLVAGHKAGLIYNTFPLMEGQWLPEEWAFYKPLWVNIFKNQTMVQWCHRILAMVSWLGVLTCLIYERKSQTIKMWFIVSTLQVLLGIITLLYHVPLVMGVLHQGWAVVVLTTGLRVLFGKNSVAKVKQPLW